MMRQAIGGPARMRREAYALYLAYRDPRLPWPARLLLLALVAYLISPVDVIPDFIPVLGALDDLLILPLSLALARRLIPAEVLRDARAAADLRLAAGGRRFWLAALAVVLIWLALAAGVSVALWRSV